MIDTIKTLIVEHQGAFAVGAAWFTREVHIVWPFLVDSYPKLASNGGVIGIIRTILIGQKLSSVTPPVTETPKQ